jgi:esterase
MQLRHTSFGNGHPLIILHGLFGSLDNWQTIARKLSGDFRVIALDQRNHGGSPHVDSLSYGALAQDLYTFMREQRIDSAYLLGHSMGGSAAMQFAAERPDMVDRLIVVDIAPRAYEPRHEKVLDAIRSVDPAQFSKRNEIDGALRSFLPDTAVRQFILKNIARDGGGHFRWKFNAAAIMKNYPALLSAPDIQGTILPPTLFIIGERSSYVTDDDRAMIQRRFRDVTFRTIPGAGHWTHADVPDEFCSAVREFLTAEE